MPQQRACVFGFDDKEQPAMPHSDLVQSVLRSLSILDLVAYSEHGLSLQDICHLLNLKRPTAYNLLRTLVARNYIARTPPPVRYRLGEAVFHLADQVAHHNLVIRAAGVLRRLYDEMVSVLPRAIKPDEEISAVFAKSLGGEIRLLLRIRNDNPAVLVRPMSIMNPYRSTSSLIYQAYWTREERTAYRRSHPFEEHGARLWKNERELNLYLHQIRLQGYANPQIYPADEYRLGVPVFDDRHVLVGVIGVGVWMRLNKLTRFRIVRIAMDAARQLSSSPQAVPKRA
ncbi:MAG TPA: helix-turn-helix domain-containing protein [Phycisphaeraceae bacterium]